MDTYIVANAQYVSNLITPYLFILSPNHLVVLSLGGFLEIILNRWLSSPILVSHSYFIITSSFICLFTFSVFNICQLIKYYFKEEKKNGKERKHSFQNEVY